MAVLIIDAGFLSLLPKPSPEELTLLERSLRSEGCRDPLIVWKNEEGFPTLLDGHNRHAICTRRGIPYTTVLVKDCPDRETAILWIVANQLGRRNLTPSEKAALAVEIEEQLAVEAKKRRAATLKQNQSADRSKLTEREQGKAIDQAAAMVGASAGYVHEAKQIKQDAPEVFSHVKQGKLSIPQAKKIVALPTEDQPAAIDRALKKEPITEGGWIYQDGKLVEVQTNAEVATWSHAQSQLLDAVIALGTMPITPEQYLRAFSPDATEEIDQHLMPAVQWLSDFVKCWRTYAKAA